MNTLLVILLAATAPLTLESALEQAEENDLRWAFVDDDDAAATWAAHRGLTQVLPTLSVGAQITQNPTEVEINGRVVTPLVVPQASAQARVSLFRGPEIPNAIAGYLLQGAVHTQSKERREALAHDVAMRFLAMAEADALKDARSETLRRAKDFVRLTAVRVNLGEGIPLDVDNAKAELARLESEVALVNGEHSAAEIRLREVVAPASTEKLAVTCDECVPEAKEHKGAVRDDIVAAQKRIDAAFVSEVGNWMTFLPSLEVIGNGRLQQPTLFNPNLVWWNVQLVLSWEIFSGGETLVDGLNARRQSRRARLDAQWLERTAKTDVTTAEVALDGGRAVFAAAQERVSAAASALKRAQGAFDEGEVNTLVVTDAARNLETAEVALVQARFRLMRARLFLRRAAGLPPIAAARTPS